jgi:hypothetical protein
MRARHNGEVDWVAIGVCAECTIALIVAEAVFNANNDPNRSTIETEQWAVATVTYHRFVKTTPKPNATKNNSGELELLPPGLPVGEGEADGVGEEVGVAMLSMAACSGRCW